MTNMMSTETGWFLNDLDVDIRSSAYLAMSCCFMSCAFVRVITPYVLPGRCFTINIAVIFCLIQHRVDKARASITCIKSLDVSYLHSFLNG